MSRLNDLLRRLDQTDAALAKDLRREVEALTDRRAFGLNFERHAPEAVELPGRPVRRGDKVRVLPPRGSKIGSGDQRLWRVTGFTRTDDDARSATLELLGDEAETSVALVDDLVVVAEFRDPIYPGLVSTGKVERGGDKPYHAVINAENYHALQTLLFTHRGKVDAIYIDPPYNTGAKDWKYNNDYVEGEDLYRHSKWLAFMERRLKLARDLLHPAHGALLVTIDENEVARLTLLLEQTFDGWLISPIQIRHNPRGVQGDVISMTHETALVVTRAGHKVRDGRRLSTDEIEAGSSPLRNWGAESLRTDAATCFYPIFVRDGEIVGFGDYLHRDDETHPEKNETLADGTIAVWPIDSKGVERKWRYSRSSVEAILGVLRVKTATKNGLDVVDIEIAKTHGPVKSVWVGPLLDANTYGSQVLGALLPDRKFPFPKSLYAVKDAIEMLTAGIPDALVLDFFAGSGTTAHATMLLNAEDGGRRRSISISNNEIAASEQKGLLARGLRPGHDAWEALGICEYITKARVKAAIIGKATTGAALGGEYRTTPVRAMGEGFEENAIFYSLTYESPLAVSSHRDFEQIAPLLWLRAGAVGPCIDSLHSSWEVTERYGVLADLNQSEAFIEALVASESARMAFVVTDEDRLFESVVRELPDGVEPVRLYEAYLQNFEIETSRSAL